LGCQAVACELRKRHENSGRKFRVFFLEISDLSRKNIITLEESKKEKKAQERPYFMIQSFELSGQMINQVDLVSEKPKEPRSCGLGFFQLWSPCQSTFKFLDHRSPFVYLFIQLKIVECYVEAVRK